MSPRPAPDSSYDRLAVLTTEEPADVDGGTTSGAGATRLVSPWS
ncbi:hypothetical protein [Streptomyces sp. NPDC058424]